MVRLLTYLPGTPVAKITTNAQILYEIGRLAASVDEVLSEVSAHASASDFSLSQCLQHLLIALQCLLPAFLTCKMQVGDCRCQFDPWLRCQPAKAFPQVQDK